MDAPGSETAWRIEEKRTRAPMSTPSGVADLIHQIQHGNKSGHRVDPEAYFLRRTPRYWKTHSTKQNF